MSSFAFHNFRNQNLQSRSFKGQDLTNTDFSYADIRETDFTGANLTGANFSHAKAGLAARWVIGMVIIAAILAAMAGIGAAIAPYCSIVPFNRVPGFNTILPEAPKNSIGLIPALMMFLLIVSANTSFLIIYLRQGIQKAFISAFIAVTISIPLIGFFSAIGTQYNHLLYPLAQFRLSAFVQTFNNRGDNEGAAVTISLIASLLGTITVTVALPLAVTLAEVVGGNLLKNLVIFETMAIATIATEIITYNNDWRVRFRNMEY